MDDRDLSGIDPDPERAVLGLMLRAQSDGSDALAEAAAALTAHDFASHKHGLIFSAALALWDGGGAADLVGVLDLLRDRGQVHEWAPTDEEAYPRLVGDLRELWVHVGCPSRLAHYAGIIREKSILRQLGVAAGQIDRDVKSPPGSAAEVLASAERLISNIAEQGSGLHTAPLADLVRAACARAEDRSRMEATPGLPTGFAPLDHLLGGLQPSELVVVAARPSVGKTALSLALARNASRSGLVFFASLEQPGIDLADRLLAADANLDGQRIRKGDLAPDEWTRLGAARDRLAALPLVFDEAPAQSVLRIGANARRLKRQGLRLVVADYLQLIQPADPRARRHEQVGDDARRLKVLARELQIPVVCLAQLNREVENRPGGKPRLSDLRDSGEIEQHADVVILLHRPADEPGSVEAIVAKQRNGPTDSVLLRFDRSRLRFEDAAASPFRDGGLDP